MENKDDLRRSRGTVHGSQSIKKAFGTWMPREESKGGKKKFGGAPRRLGAKDAGVKNALGRSRVGQLAVFVPFIFILLRSLICRL